MEIEIKDPAQALAPPPAGVTPVITVFPLPVMTWVLDLSPIVPASIDIINNLRDPRRKNVTFNGETCWEIGGDPIVPASYNNDIVVENLRPSKLYNAVIFSRYSKNGGTFHSKQVHSYPFQTSRYANLQEQVNSYHLDIATHHDAIFKITYDLNQLGFTINHLRDVISGHDAAVNFRPDIISNYPDPFQRLLSGYLKQDPLPPALNTEINLIYNEVRELIGIWVRNPEPFNDPRIPHSEMVNTIKLLIDGIHIPAGIPLFSKDNTECIIFLKRLRNVSSSLKLRFSYLVWNGTAYVSEQHIITENLIV
jgi:hypothetical protein